MIREMVEAIKPELATETALWRGVIARSIQDWLAAPLRLRREADRYLFQDSADLTLVCESAGINVKQMRTRLNMVRGRTLEDVLQMAA
jgi:hypothetical protein